MDLQSVKIRPYEEEDFSQIAQLNRLEGWDNLVARGDDTKLAWVNSNVAYVATEGPKVIGYIRGMTDQQITLFICELLTAQEYRGYGIGKKLLNYVHHLYPSTRMELLASSTSRTFYEQLNFRSMYGYRKTIHE